MILFYFQLDNKILLCLRSVHDKNITVRPWRHDKEKKKDFWGSLFSFNDFNTDNQIQREIQLAINLQHAVNGDKVNFTPEDVEKFHNRDSWLNDLYQAIPQELQSEALSTPRRQKR